MFSLVLHSLVGIPHIIGQTTQCQDEYMAIKRVKSPLTCHQTADDHNLKTLLKLFTMFHVKQVLRTEIQCRHFSTERISIFHILAVFVSFHKVIFFVILFLQHSSNSLDFPLLS